MALSPRRMAILSSERGARTELTLSAGIGGCAGPLSAANDAEKEMRQATAKAIMAMIGRPYGFFILSSAPRKVLNDGGSHEYEELALVIRLHVVLEKPAQQRNVLEDGDAVLVVGLRDLVDAADDDRLAVLYEHFTGGFIRADPGRP